MSSKYETWMSEDITWCARKCDDTDCFRNLKNKKLSGLYSTADMFDPFKCPVDAELPEKGERQCR